MLRRIWWIGLLVTAWPEAAFAHSSVPGLAGLYTGMLHPFTMASQLLLLIALALFVQQRLPDSELTLYAALIGSLAGLAAGASGYLSSAADMPAIAAAVVTALFVAAAWPRGTAVLLPVGAVSGAASGMLSWPDAGGKPGAMIMTGLGAAVGGFLFVLIVAMILEIIRAKLPPQWFPVAVRIAASWTAAVALLLGALAFKTNVQ